MSAQRRRSHGHTVTSGDLRADGLAALLARVLAWARANHASAEIHGCSACLTDVAIYEDKASELGVTLASDKEQGPDA